jgi:hypothetical protein
MDYQEQYSYLIGQIDSSEKDEFPKRHTALKNFIDELPQPRSSSDPSIVDRKKFEVDRKKFERLLADIILPGTMTENLNSLIISFFIKVITLGKVSKSEIIKFLNENNEDDVEGFIESVFSNLEAKKNFLILEGKDQGIPDYAHAKYKGFWFLESISKNFDAYKKWYGNQNANTRELDKEDKLISPLIEFEDGPDTKVLCVYLKGISRYSFPGMSASKYISDGKYKMGELKADLNEMFFPNISDMEKKITTVKQFCTIPRPVDTHIPLDIFRLEFDDKAREASLLGNAWKLIDKSPAKVIDSKAFSYDEILVNRVRGDMLGEIADKVKIYVMLSILNNVIQNSKVSDRIEEEAKEKIEGLLLKWSKSKLPLRLLSNTVQHESNNELVNLQLKKIVKEWIDHHAEVV